MWIRIHKSPEYGSNTDPDPQHCAVFLHNICNATNALYSVYFPRSQCVYSMYFALRYVNVTVCRSVYSAQLHETQQGGSRLGYKQARLGYFDMLNKLRHLQHSSCKFFERYRNIFKRDTGIKMNRFRTYATDRP